MGVPQLFTSIYHPQTNGLVEKTNLILKGLLRKTTGGFPREWDTCLDAVLFTLRKTPHASTSLLPFMVLYG